MFKRRVCILSMLACLSLMFASASGAAQGFPGIQREAGDVAAPAALPRLEIDTDGGELPGDADERGWLRLTEPGGAGEARVVETPVEINLRGNTSRRFPKKSYRLKIIDGDGRKRDLSIAGLREDDDWILNPMYADTSKLREALSYWLWEEMNRCGQAAASSRLAFAEVWLNGEYWGLYGVQERVDRKQVGADKRMGILYKVTANDRPAAEELLACEDPEACRGIELAYAGEWVEAPWAPAAGYMALLEGGEADRARLSRENAVDYGLWSALVQASDCHFKNQYIHCVPAGEGYVLYHIPWDLNHTLGDLWSGDSPETNYMTYAIGDLAVDDALAALLESGDAALIRDMKARWAELRSGPVTEENILARANALFEALYPAILRDSDRWPECGMGEGSAANIRDIEDYVRTMLPRLDGWIGSGLPGPAR